ncbi:hypothetical protein C8J57DRAFT_1519647 [Mycena rebaudengoi]|nr:hypothetical protein C8J57DRAFT_1519647 [Mycena rebaudengoi]
MNSSETQVLDLSLSDNYDEGILLNHSTPPAGRGTLSCCPFLPSFPFLFPFLFPSLLPAALPVRPSTHFYADTPIAMHPRASRQVTAYMLATPRAALCGIAALTPGCASSILDEKHRSCLVLSSGVLSPLLRDAFEFVMQSITAVPGTWKHDELTYQDLDLIRVGERNAVTDGIAPEVLRLAQVRVLFTAPCYLRALFNTAKSLVCIEWFAPLWVQSRVAISTSCSVAPDGIYSTGSFI